MSRYSDTLEREMGDILGESWAIETDHSTVVLTHSNGSRVLSWLAVDGRRNATRNDAIERIDGMRRKLAGEIHKYTPEWATRGREALESLTLALEMARRDNERAAASYAGMVVAS